MMKNKCERNKMIKTGDERRMEKKAKILIIEDDEEISGNWENICPGPVMILSVSVSFPMWQKKP